MAALRAIVFLGLAASSVLALPEYGSHSHGTSVKPTGSARSHSIPSGTRASSGVHSHSRPVKSSGISSVDAAATSAAYIEQQTASTSCLTVTTKIKVTVTITADETSAAGIATFVMPVSVSSAVVTSESHIHAHSRHHSSSSKATEVETTTATSVESASISTSLAAVATSSSSISTSASLVSSSATYAIPSEYSSESTQVSTDILDRLHRPVTSISAIVWPSIAATTDVTISTHLTSSAPIASTSTAHTTAAAAAAAASSSSSSMAKRGLAYNDASLVSNFASSSKIGWAYNWGSWSGTLPSSIMYIPTLWGPSSTFTNSWVSNAKAAVSKGSTHVFSFNEPDMTSQSNLTPEAAAEAYKTWISDEFKDNTNVKLCAPSVTNGVNSAKTMGLDWLASFLTLAKEKGARVDCVNIHWYGTEVSDLTSHVNQAIAQANAAGISDVWLTEFGLNGNPSASTISTFLESALPSLESTSLTGYAYFMLSNNILVNGNSLNTAGQTYLSSA